MMMVVVPTGSGMRAGDPGIHAGCDAGDAVRSLPGHLCDARAARGFPLMDICGALTVTTADAGEAMVTLIGVLAVAGGCCMVMVTFCVET